MIRCCGVFQTPINFNARPKATITLVLCLKVDRAVVAAATSMLKLGGEAAFIFGIARGAADPPAQPERRRFRLRLPNHLSPAPWLLRNLRCRPFFVEKARIRVNRLLILSWRSHRW